MREKGRVDAFTSKDFKVSIPFSVTALRGFTAPLLLYTIVSGMETWVKGLLLLACATDLLDGYLARKLDVSSDLGTYFDVTADFLVIMTAFVAFVIVSIYPFWLPAVVTFMFAQFIATSRLGRPVYDPIGRYYGTFLFAAIGTTLTFPAFTVYCAISIGILGLTAASVASRSVFLLSNWIESFPKALDMHAST